MYKSPAAGPSTPELPNVGEEASGSASRVRTPSLWMRSAAFDLGFFQLSGLAALLLLLPYVFSGKSVIFPIYNFYLIFFGLPHNYLTWATIFPKESRKTFNMGPVYTAAIACAALCLLIPMTVGSDLNDWILSFISYYSFWHAYRQHHGICKVYDSIQAKRTGDTTIFANRKAMNLFFGFAANAVLVWAFTQGRIYYLLSLDDRYELIHPSIPRNIYLLYVGVTAAIGLWALKRSVWDRYRAGRFIPWPQIALMAVAVATYIVPYFFISLSEMPLAVAIGTIYHNVQYFGFVWLTERHRSVELRAGAEKLGFPQALAFRASWKRYFGLALLYSFMVTAFYMATPRYIGLTFIYFLGISHYIIDGYIWRRDNNRLLGAVLTRVANAGRDAAGAGA